MYDIRYDLDMFKCNLKIIFVIGNLLVLNVIFLVLNQVLTLFKNSYFKCYFKRFFKCLCCCEMGFLVVIRYGVRYEVLISEVGKMGSFVGFDGVCF